MKKWKISICAAVFAGLVMCGCGGKNEDSNDKPTPTTAVNENENSDSLDNQQESQEPTLTSEAKKRLQFADIKSGETYAKIHVESFGTMVVKFFPEKAPKAVENFITHAKNGYYDGLTFHRVMDDFMIQGGDPKGNGTGGESIWKEDFEDEFSDDLHPFRGALCMANAGANTNGSQFFIVQADAGTITEMETLLKAQYDIDLGTYCEAAYGTRFSEEELEGYRLYGGTPWLFEKHTVFGQLMEGFDVLDAIAAVETGSNNMPVEKVVIRSVEIVE